MRRPVLAAALWILFGAAAPFPASAQPLPARPRALTTYVAPVYPSIAASARVTGVVQLEATVAPDGRVQTARVLRSVPFLDDAALKAVRQWRFAPGEVAVTIPVRVDFRIGKGPPSSFERVPGWPGTEFTFHYLYQCASGIAEIRPDSLAFSRSAAGGQRIELQFQERELQALAAQLVAVDRSSASQTRLPAQPPEEMQQTGAGIDVRISIEVPVIFVATFDGPNGRGHVLYVWMTGEWHMLAWDDVYRNGALVPSHEALAAIGTFIRDTVAQKPGVRELRDDHRECLQ